MVKRVLNKLENDIRYRDRLDHIEVLHPKNAVYGKVENLPDNIQNYLNRSGIKLYEHQCQSLEHIRKKTERYYNYSNCIWKDSCFQSTYF